MPNSKYVVFKRDDWDAATEQLDREDVIIPYVGDAVVIRTQDLFAAGGLSAYAHNIRAQVVIMEQRMLEDVRNSQRMIPIGMHSDYEAIERLREVAKYFDGVAAEAEDRLARGECKLPD